VYVYSHLQSLAAQSTRLPDSLCVKLHECLEESIYYDEVLVAFSRLQTECRDFVGLMQTCGATGSTLDYMTEYVFLVFLMLTSTHTHTNTHTYFNFMRLKGIGSNFYG